MKQCIGRMNDDGDVGVCTFKEGIKKTLDF